MHSVMAQPFEAPREQISKRVWFVFRATMKLTLPVLMTSILLAMAFLYKDAVVTRFDVFPPQLGVWNPSQWLTVGHLLLPLAFFLVNLTNRRFGPRFAVSQVVATWVMLGITVLIILFRFGDGSTDNGLPPAQISVAFLVAFFLAQLVSINVFNKTRGRTWWGAPLISIVWASVVYAVIFHPVANWGTGEEWLPKMVMDIGIKTGTAVFLLVPYHLLRRAIKPLPGYGGA